MTKLLWTMIGFGAAFGSFFAVIFACTLAGCEFTVPKERLLVAAASADDLPRFKRIAARGVSIDIREKGFLGQTPLTASTESAGTNVFFYLLSAGAKLEATDRNDMTALVVSVMNGDNNFTKTKALVEAGADVNFRDNSGPMVLRYAQNAGLSGFSTSNTVAFLKEHGAR